MKTSQKNPDRQTGFLYGYLIIVLFLLLAFNQIIMDSFGYFIKWLVAIAKAEIKYDSVFDSF